MIENPEGSRGAPLQPGAGPGEALFLDLDGTLVAASTERAFVEAMYRSGRVGPWRMAVLASAFLGHALGLVGDFAATKRRVCRILLRSEPVEPCLAWYEAFFEGHLRALLRPELLAGVRAFQGAGRPVFLVSASLDFLVEPFARAIQAESAHATEALRERGRFTGELGEPVLSGEAKADLLRRLAREHGLDLSVCAACGDDSLDIPMLAAVGRPLAVHPTRRLARHARRQGWPILGVADAGGGGG